VGVKVAVLVAYETEPATALLWASTTVIVLVVIVLAFMSLSKLMVIVEVMGTSVALLAGLFELTRGGAEELPVGDPFA
jgi:hypothetical protein